MTKRSNEIKNDKLKQTIRSAHAATSRPLMAESLPPQRPAPVASKIKPRPDWNDGIHKRYARVLALIGFGALERRNRKSQREVLKEAGEAIKNFSDFRILCAADLFKAWDHHQQTGIRIAHHRVETWERVYAYWHKKHGSPDHGSVILISATDKWGNYSIHTRHDQRHPHERLWQTVEKACEKMGVPDKMVAAFRRDCEEAIRDQAPSSACAADEVQGTVVTQTHSADKAPRKGSAKAAK